MSSCCPPKAPDPKSPDSCHDSSKVDYWLYGSLGIIIVSFIIHLFPIPLPEGVIWQKYENFIHHNFDLMNKMWLGIFVGALAVGALQYVPSSKIQSIMATKSRTAGLFRATLAGVLLDLCSHGILMVGLKLYKKGFSLGQTMAFLIASPWNSFSLTVILVSLIGLKWTLLFVVFSGLIAIISGFIFDTLVERKILPENPNQLKEIDPSEAEGPGFWASLPKKPKAFFTDVVWFGFKDSLSILKWLFIGVILASLLREVLDPSQFQTYFGPDLTGLLMTLLLATVVEVCSEGSAPIASDIMLSANAPGNSFGFLMTGVSTDYTEIMAIKESMKSWKVALFLPLVTIPQIVLIAVLMNINR